MSTGKKGVLYIGNYLSKHDKTPTICELLAPKLEEYIPVYTASEKKYQFFRLLDMLFSFFKYRKRFSFVLIDTYSSLAFWYSWIIAFVARSYGKKYIPIIHGGRFEHRLQKTPFFTRYLLKNAHCIVVPSLFIKELLQKYTYNNLHYIPNFMDLELYTYKAERTPAMKIIWVRAFHKVYNPILAVKIIKELKDRGENPSLCMIGPQKDKSARMVEKAIRKYQLKDHIIITGRLSKKEWIKISENYALFLNTSLIDTFPMTIAEAMALGLPIISSKTGGIPYEIRDGIDGFLVDNENIAEFADKIIFMNKNPDRLSAMLKANRKKVEAFDWNMIKKEWKLLIDNI
jgi:glycosyltransferase involved in cell wall biosynthesis